MEEKMLKARSGMLYLVLFIGLYLLSIVVFIVSLNMESLLKWPLLVLSAIWILVGYIPFFGLKVLQPQEALVLTLFGNYSGTLKGDGFFFVNPFSSAVNPAAGTRLGQSRDVNDEYNEDDGDDEKEGDNVAGEKKDVSEMSESFDALNVSSKLKNSKRTGKVLSFIEYIHVYKAIILYLNYLFFIFN